MTADAAQRIRGLRKTYGSVVAVDGIDLDIVHGQIVALLGHNGAGKTTLVSSVAGLRRPDAGTIEIDGVDARRDPVAARRRLGPTPQVLAVLAPLAHTDRRVCSSRSVALNVIASSE